jgi:glyoxylase-like metal-dependent hydrolase (beta-lactamase superfamily II)
MGPLPFFFQARKSFKDPAVFRKGSGFVRVVTLPVGELSTNCYIVLDPESGKCIVIDRGLKGSALPQRFGRSEATFTPSCLLMVILTTQVLPDFSI